MSRLLWYNWSFLFKYQKDALRNGFFFPLFAWKNLFAMLDNSLSWGKTLLCNNFLSEGTDRQAGAGTVSDATESLQMFLCVAFFSTEEMAVYPEEMDKLSMVIPYRTSHCQFEDSGGGSEETSGVPTAAFIIRIIDCSRIGVQLFGNGHSVA